MAPKQNVVPTRRSTRLNSETTRTTGPKRKAIPKKKVAQKTVVNESSSESESEREEEATVTMTQTEIDALIAEKAAALFAAEQSKESAKKAAKGKEKATAQVTKPTRGSTSRNNFFNDFINCKPLPFTGTEGAVGLLQWFEKIESTFRLSDCIDANRVKYATGTFSDTALSWWTAHTNTIGIDEANNMPWEDVKELLRDEYCPRNEIQKLEAEFWVLAVKGNNVAAYTKRFHELSVICPALVTPERKKIERFTWGLPLSIQGNVISAAPPTIAIAVRLAHSLMDAIVRHVPTPTKAVEVRNFDNNKRKWDNSEGRNFTPQQFGRPNTFKAYNAGPSNGTSNRLTCVKCQRHHTGNCIVCSKCKKFGHLARECRSAGASTNNIPLGNCFHCGGNDHWRNRCPKLNAMPTQRANGRAFEEAGYDQTPK